MKKIKHKTHRGAAKRFKPKKSGKIKRYKAYKSHILNNDTKRPKRKRNLRKPDMVDKSNMKQLKRMLGI